MDTPWITFTVDLTAMSPEFWMTLGEARSKCDHLAKVPMPPEYARDLHLVMLTKGVHATTAIEGNTLSEATVASIVRRPKPKTASATSSDYQQREVENVLGAYNSVLDELGTGVIPTLTPDLIKRFNLQVLEGLDNDDDVTPGELRRHSVAVGPYRGPDWQKCEDLLNQMCSWLNGPAFDGAGSKRIPIAIIKASLAHLYLAWIHPFGDGNGRTARLCEYLVLVTSGVPSSAAHLISNYCNQTRDQYYRELAYASQSNGDIAKFLAYCANGFVLGLTEQLKSIYDRQFRLTWHEFVGMQVTGRDSDMRHRRALIAEQLLFRPPVAKRDIARLTPELAEIYATSGPRTLARDLNDLEGVGLIKLTEDGYIADSTILLSQLPISVPEPERSPAG